MLINPYIAGNPARSGSFFGRQDVLEWVRDELRSPPVNVLVIFGQRRIGKTSLLLRLEVALPRDSYLPIYFDLQDKAREPLPLLLKKLAGAIARRVEIPSPELNAFKEDGDSYFCDVFIPQVFEKIGQGVRVVLLFDEFDVVDRLDSHELSGDSAAKSFHPFLHELMSREPRVAFVFATGRSTEDLNLDMQATFKASLQKHLWVLDQTSARSLIKQGEDQGSLVYTDRAIEKILKLTSGHPYLTQLLCHHIWAFSERRRRTVSLPPGMVDRRQRKRPREVFPKDVREALPEALESGDNALVWIWDGLTAVEKVLTAAMGGLALVRGAVSVSRVVENLAKYAPKQRPHEIEAAARDLVKRKVLKKIDGDLLAFEVVIFQQWVKERKPLREVENELDRMDPEAERLYGAANLHLQKKEWNLSILSLQLVLEKYPQHVHAHLDLGECYLSVGNSREAVRALEDAHRLSPRIARLSLVRALIVRARENLLRDEREVLAICDRIRHLSPREPEVALLEKEAWHQQGDGCLRDRDRRQALLYYRKSEDLKSVKEIELYKARCRHALGEIIEIAESAISLAQKVSASCNRTAGQSQDDSATESLLVIANLYRAEEGSLRLLIGALGALGREQIEVVRKKFDDAQRVAPRQERLGELSSEERLAPKAGEMHSAARMSVDFISLVEQIMVACGAIEVEFDDKMYLEGWRLTREFLSGRLLMANHYLMTVVNLFQGEVDRARRQLEPFRDDFGSPMPISGLSESSRGTGVVSISGHSEARHAAFSPNRKYLAVSSNEAISLSLVASGQQVHIFEKNPASIYQVVFSPDGSSLLAISQDGRIKMWSIPDGSPLSSPETKEKPHVAAFSPQGGCLAFGTRDGRLLTWSQKSGWAPPLQRAQSEVSAISYSSDGTRLAAGFIEGFIQLWHLEDQRIEILDEHESAVCAVVFSPDGRFLASGSQSGELRIWNLERDMVICDEKSHTEKIGTLAFSSDGNLLVSGSFDETARLWRSPYWKCVAITQGNPGGVLDGVFSDDDANVFLVLPARKLRVWEISHFRSKLA